MQFTKLRLLGFKSFVDPTELVIADGLTGVVGPNGCGKSNLLEALRWVMGENRPTAMRGGGMEDVIFAGASTRPARNFAEVTLTIDNDERLAPAAFNDADRLEIVRRITRDAGSAFKTNGKDSRARDVQMLFADASTGSHSPALVRQGQISELINAKPKARRRILEEAAGISGLYQRRHEAELKLKATSANLERVEDVLGQLSSQLATLARQARQAERYREIAEELRRSEALLLYRRWREADEARLAADQALTVASRLAAEAQGAASKAQTLRTEAADKLPPLREEEAVAGAVLQRLTVERDQLKDREHRARRAIERLEQNIRTLRADMEREATLNTDATETIERLEWEQTALKQASAGQDETLANAQAAATDAATHLQAVEARLDQASEDAARLAARHQAAARRIADAEQVLGKLTREREEAERASAEVAGKLTAARSLLEESRSREDDARQLASAAEAALADAEVARSAAQSAEAEARATSSAAQGELKALQGEVAALSRLLDRERGDEDQLLDQIRVEPGYEAALGAALGDDLKASVTTDGTGWADVSGREDLVPPALPQGADPLAAHVQAPALLDARLARIGIVAADLADSLQSQLPAGHRLVSREGDLWRWDGFRVLAADAPSATALRLQQMNRLERLKEALTAAEAVARNAEAGHATARAELEAATSADAQARTSRKQADDAATQAARALNRAEAETSMLEGRAETLSMAVERRSEDAVEAETALADARSGQDELEDLDTARAAVEAQKGGVADARAAQLAARSKADEVRREGAARVKRLQELTKEISGWRHRLDTAEKRTGELSNRAEAAEADLKSARTQPEEIAEKRAGLARELERAEARRRAAADALAAGETVARQAEQAERDAERAASEAREGRARADARAEAAQEAVQAAADRIEEDLNVAPQVLLETLGSDPDQMPPVEMIENDIARLRRQRDALGAVNLRAEEDSREVQEEHDALASEKEDLDAAIAKLATGIANLNAEGRERLLKAFDEVNENFGRLFTSLFGGGEASLELVESDDPLEAGLEIMCQPPGKKLSTLSLLSGGEQTLTALSLIFAVFLANPSPICVLDEVDAPLDDANVTRFCDLLDEMTRQTSTRFLIITHHAVTMARMDRLFGVTMAEQGVSQLVSVDLRRAEALVS
ncbi:chromosome segregation protein SMC [Pontivivens insulae]|uniref:Chromosome partition protein Smc n=1 Tax=Pontivivens insulae TaxID=1639689 RepID=A0A2R8AEW9_9RHOB|nr:chromosome segregation protein SMC [Pontivivens insulae]RED12035.1 condensin subunit Smc [Pontivivens insulae]SPF30791.1 Chromosome partition protein Smc [Pontivivens insulae]